MIALLLKPLLFVAVVWAAPECAPNGPLWWLNAFGETPCDVQEMVARVLSPEADVPLLEAGAAYKAENSETQCNPTYYNLASACRCCQTGETADGIAYGDFVANCGPTKIDNKSLPSFWVTDELKPRLTQWMLMDTSDGGWIYAQAEAVAIQEGAFWHASASIASVSSATATPSSTPGTSSSGPSPAAIGGGVAGALVALGGLALAFLLLRRRRRDRHRNWPGSSATSTSTQRLFDQRSPKSTPPASPASPAFSENSYWNPPFLRSPDPTPGPELTPAPSKHWYSPRGLTEKWTPGHVRLGSLGSSTSSSFHGGLPTVAEGQQPVTEEGRQRGKLVEEGLGVGRPAAGSPKAGWDWWPLRYGTPFLSLSPSPGPTEGALTPQPLMGVVLGTETEWRRTPAVQFADPPAVRRGYI